MITPKSNFQHKKRSRPTPLLAVSVGILLVFWLARGNVMIPDELVLLNGDENGNEVDSLHSIRKAFAGFTNEQLKPLVRIFTMVGPLHLDLAMKAVEKLNTEGIEGAIVECGVWKGGLSMGMLLVNQRHNTDRHFYLFDTFEGLPEPTDDKNGRQAKDLFKMVQDRFEHNKTNEYVDMLEKRGDFEDGKLNYGPLDVVRNNMYYSGYPRDKIHFVQGKVEDTLKQPELLPDKIALLRLDTDWYESTKVELEVLFDRLQPGGLLAVDDYCHWQGSQHAVNEYFEQKLNLNTTEISKNLPCLHYWKPGK